MGRRSVEELAQDLRFDLRSFFRNPGFTAVAALTLALGIGANTAIFSAVNSVLLQPLRFRDPDRLVRVFSNRGTPAYLPVSGEDYFDWASQNHSFEGISLYSSPQNFNASGTGEPETVSVVSAQANFFSVIGVAPRFGREFAVTKHLAVEYPITNGNLGAQIVSLKKLLTGDSRPQLLVMLGAVALVLLVACANVANLWLARATVRQREIALRATLGATRWRLIRQLLTESVTLSCVGAALGLRYE